MAGRRTRAHSGGGDGAARAAAVAGQLHLECGHLLELFRKKECLGADLQVQPDPLLVTVPPASAQLEVRDQLWRIHSALSQCRCLLDRAIVREERELGLATGGGGGGGGKADYLKQRKTVKDRLTLLLASTRELLLAAGGTTGLTPTPTDCVEPDAMAVLFEVKMWIYRIFQELDYWSRTAVDTLQALPAGGATRTSTRRNRNARR